MVVLALVVLSLITGIILQSMDQPNMTLLGMDNWRLTQFGILVIVHCVTGISSWGAHYHSFGNRALWVVAICTHPMVYILNWELYAALSLSSDSHNLIQNLNVLVLIIIPSMLLYGGPFNAVINPKRSDD